MRLLSAPSTSPPLKPRPGALYFSILPILPPPCDNLVMAAPITPPTIRPGGFSSPPPIHPCALPPPPGIHCVTTPNSAFERFNPFLPRPQWSEAPAIEELVFPPQRKPPSPCNQAKFLSPAPPKPSNERLWKRGGGLRIVSMPTRPSFPDPPSRPAMVGLGLVIPLPQAARHITPGDKAPRLQPVQEQKNGDGVDIRRPEELARSLLTKAPASSLSTSHSSHIKLSKDTATTSCKVPLPPLPLTPFQSRAYVSQAATMIASCQVPKSPLCAIRPKLKRFDALLPNATHVPSERDSQQEIVPIIPFANRSKARGPPRSKVNAFVPSGRVARRYSRHMQSLQGLRSNASSRRNSGSSINSSKSGSISTSSSCIGEAGSTSLPIAALRLVRYPPVKQAGSICLSPVSSDGAISIASWLELGDNMSLPGDIVSSSPEPIDPNFTTIVEEDWEDDVPRVCLPGDLTTDRDPSGVGRRLFRHGAIVRFTRTLKRARKAKALRKRIDRKQSIMEGTGSSVERWSPQVSLFPHLAQILSTPRPAMVTSESKEDTLPPVRQMDDLDPDVRNVLSSLWSPRHEDSPWAMRESIVSGSRPPSVVLVEITAVRSPRDDKHADRVAAWDYRRSQDDEEDVLQMYEDMSSCPSDGRSSGFCSSAASSRLASSTSSESMW